MLPCMFALVVIITFLALACFSYESLHFHSTTNINNCREITNISGRTLQKLNPLYNFEMLVYVRPNSRYEVSQADSEY